MAYYPQNATGLNYISYPAGPTPVGLALTANASANTKGAFAQFVASSTFTSNAINVVVANTSAATGRLYLFDIATGGSGSETVVIPNLNAEGVSTTNSVYPSGLYPFPLAIASSTRISARCQCSTGGVAMNVQITLIAAGGVSGIAAFTNYGGDTADSSGAQIDPGGTVNTKGAYTQLTASSSDVAQWMSAQFTYGHSTYANVFWLADLATGAAASEVVLVPDMLLTSAFISSQPDIQPRATPMLTYIAASTRIAARASCTSNTATARLFDLVLMTGVAPSEPSGGGGAWAFA